MNLMAVPLLLGAGVDYTIHVQLALRRHGGSASTMRNVTGRAVLLCAATTAAGFGSNALSGNAGLASLGLICSAGVLIVYATAIYLLPAWWAVFCPQADAPAQRAGAGCGAEPHTNALIEASASPSSFYRVGLWQFGMAVVRVLPTWLVKGFFVAVAELHFRLRRDRREIVVRNLLPPLAGDRAVAERTAHRLYRRFAVKLAELWKLESGEPVRQWLTAPEELEIIRAACARGRGVLFVTLHLGNWEHGGLLLNELGIKLTVLTLAEPDDNLTQLRVASRARWGIQTIVIGESDFAFVEVIKQLQAGANMALSLDRPPKKSAAEIELFGRPFGASTAAAELARASGCALIGVTIVRRPEGFAVKVLPEFKYDRQTLGNREARRQLTQQILRAFEPQIQQHLDQWYQFVPIWPEGN
jgi:lauroyl/myristoyl acyltransferase